VCVFLLMESGVEDVPYQAPNHRLDCPSLPGFISKRRPKFDVVPQRCKPAPRRVPSRTSRTAGRTRIIYLVVHLIKKHHSLRAAGQSSS
jgi:hypothetical protein